MNGRKQALLKRHRRNKRLTILILLVVLIGSIDTWVVWWMIPPLLLVCWIAHEAWFSDHLFYSPKDDYQYDFPADTRRYPVRIEKGVLQVPEGFQLADTLILEVHLRGRLLGRFIDPYVRVGDDRQDFERGVRGRRYLNLSGQGEALLVGALTLSGRFCRLSGEATLYAMSNPDYAGQRLMILAPHADDAELAAFGLYHRAEDVSIVTLTQGEIEAESYQRLGLDKAQAACLKGRLRAWNSMAVPLWGGVAQQRCVQLGYYCLQLSSMLEAPEQGFGSRESGQYDIRPVRQYNDFSLPGDQDGAPTWRNLVADLAALLERFRPEVLVTTHPEFDPHSDHIATTQALREAVAASAWKPSTLLLYANHLNDNDRWPMGPAGYGIALPPAIEPLPGDRLWSPTLSVEAQLDKAMALGMQHDLLEPLSTKNRLRRLLQSMLAGRRWPQTGENEFFRKAVRRHELFWVRPIEQEPPGEPL
ncbi:PIG-L deacetylase family protein [Pseudomonas sp. LRF_L74]|uniref:PIG-L deacetylase family protein n=1 Tax=Pseudomonas sp. LRF_L74 TaxID=3369422 RepID=UPI003F5FBA28